jgi:hypothetical protein
MELTTNYHTTIAGEEASVLEYRLSRSPSEGYFSMMAAVLGPDGRGYWLQRTSTSEGEDDVRTLFDNAVPLLQFLP